MSEVLLATNGPQGIQLIRELFASCYRPDQFFVFTDSGESKQNSCFIQFLDYYSISYCTSLEQLLEIDSDWLLAISLSCRTIFPKEIICGAKHFINFHPGLLPDYRGSNSTVHAMAAGKKTVGGTWHRLIDRVDSGAILRIITVDVKENDTAFSLNHKIFSRGIRAVSEVLSSLDSYYGFSNDVEGRFNYSCDFPDLSDHRIPDHVKQKIYYFPPKFLNYEF